MIRPWTVGTLPGPYFVLLYFGETMGKGSADALKINRECDRRNQQAELWRQERNAEERAKKKRASRSFAPNSVCRRTTAGPRRWPALRIAGGTCSPAKAAKPARTGTG